MQRIQESTRYLCKCHLKHNAALSGNKVSFRLQQFDNFSACKTVNYRVLQYFIKYIFARGHAFKVYAKIYGTYVT